VHCLSFDDLTVPPKAPPMRAFHEAGSLKGYDRSVAMQISRYIFLHYCNCEWSRSSLALVFF